MATPVQLPETLEDLTTGHALPHEDQRVRCNICREPYAGYNGDIEMERPVELPGCGHIFGANCIAEWIQTENNSCPICRLPVLDPRTPDSYPYEEEERRDQLASWAKESASSPYEYLFETLCEEIVCYIEDPSISAAQDWLVRARYREVVGLGNWKQFVLVVKGQESKLKEMIKNLEVVLPSDVVADFAIESASKTRVDLEDPIFDPNEKTFKQLEGWYRRIRRSRDALYQRLYGTAVPQ
ncbi:MAG: hypothetical protein Q9174_005093 [Haloplaca sp. 1 TL-2023]